MASDIPPSPSSFENITLAHLSEVTAVMLHNIISCWYFESKETVYNTIKQQQQQTLEHCGSEGILEGERDVS